MHVIPSEKSQRHERKKSDREHIGDSRLHRAKAIDRGDPALADDLCVARSCRATCVRDLRRLAIWRQIVRELAGEERELALAAGLEQAAVRVEASGAQIKNAVLAAMFRARQAGRPLGVEELRHGLERELSNQGGNASF